MYTTPFFAKRDIIEGTRKLLILNKKISHNPKKIEKLKKFIELKYNKIPKQKDIKEIYKVFCRSVWYEEDIQKNIEDVLDDLLVFIDKVKRGKRTYYSIEHESVKENIDWIMKGLKIVK